MLSPGEPFPKVERADDAGLLAVGGGLDPARLVGAYRKGIFPWPLMGPEAPLLWFSPDPRFVLFPRELHCPRSLRKCLRQGRFRVAANTRFSDVVMACGSVRRAGQEGSWITEAMVDAYQRLHLLGFAHSIEVYREDERGENELVGGLYGIALGQVFFGESMFSHATDASKVGFVVLARQLALAGFGLIDCQQETGHLRQFGARSIRRAEFVERIGRLVDRSPTDDAWTKKVSLDWRRF